jgi:hypothetical protein
MSALDDNDNSYIQPLKHSKQPLANNECGCDGSTRYTPAIENVRSMIAIPLMNTLELRAMSFILL